MGNFIFSGVFSALHQQRHPIAHFDCIDAELAVFPSSTNGLVNFNGS